MFYRKMYVVDFYFQLFFLFFRGFATLPASSLIFFSSSILNVAFLLSVPGGIFLCSLNTNTIAWISVVEDWSIKKSCSGEERSREQRVTIVVAFYRKYGRKSWTCVGSDIVDVFIVKAFSDKTHPTREEILLSTPETRFSFGTSESFAEFSYFSETKIFIFEKEIVYEFVHEIITELSDLNKNEKTF